MMTKYEVFVEALKNYKGSNESVKRLARLLTEEVIFSADDIRKLNDDTLYFTKKELLDLIDRELSKADYRDIDMGVVDICFDSLDKGLYFETIEEAEAHFDEVVEAQRGGQ